MPHPLPWLNPARVARLEQSLRERILIIDGAMGTMIQRHQLEEADYRGERFASGYDQQHHPAHDGHGPQCGHDLIGADGAVLFLGTMFAPVQDRHAPGGGFIAALAASAIVALLYLSTSRDRQIGPPRLPLYLIGGGVVVAVGSGIWGLLAVPLTNSGASLSAQLLGAACIFAWVFVASLLVWGLIKLVMGLRVSEEDEYEGVDIAECGLEAYPEFTRK